MNPVDRFTPAPNPSDVANQMNKRIGQINGQFTEHNDQIAANTAAVNTATENVTALKAQVTALIQALIQQGIAVS